MGLPLPVKKRISTLLIAILFLVTSIGLPLLSIAPAEAQITSGNAQWMHRGLIAYNGIYFFDNDTTDGVFHYDSKDPKFGGCTASFQFSNIGDQDANRFFFDSGNRASRTKYIEPQTSTDATGATDCGKTTTREVTIDNVAKRRITFIRLDDNTIVHYKHGTSFKKSPGNARVFVRDGDGSKCKDLIFLREAVASNSDGPFTKGQTISGSSILYAVGDANNNDGDGFGFHAESYGDVINNNELKDTKKCGMAFAEIYNAGSYALVRNWNSSYEQDKVDGFFSYGVNSQADVYSAPPKNDDAFIIFVGDTSSFPTNPSTGQPVTGNPTGSQQVRPSCDLGFFGWILCELVKASEFALKSMEGFIFQFIGIQPLVVNDVNSPVFKVWSGLRDIANVLFIIGFLFIVFSQATSIGINNYGIKKLLPMLIVTAILTNISYFVCAFFIDISNIAAAGVRNLVEGMIGGDLDLSSLPLPDNMSVTGVSLSLLSTGGGLLAILIKAKGFVVLVVPVLIVILGSIIAVLLLVARWALLNLIVMISAILAVLLLFPNTRNIPMSVASFSGLLLALGPAVSLSFGVAQITASLLLALIGAGA